MRVGGNEYNLQELAGAFGDLGTLIPFLVVYITISKMDPVGVLVGFGAFKIIAGLYYKTPMPIQPMKAIGTAAISHAGALGAGVIWAAGLFTGVFWLMMGLTGAVTWVSKITSRPIIHGIILGLGLSFILEGVKMMHANPFLALFASALTFLLLSYERIPAMLILLGLGMLIALTFEPVLIGELGQMSFHLRLPTFALTELWQSDLVTGVLVLGLPHCWRVHVEYGRGIWSGTRTLARLPTRMAQSLNEPSSVASYSLGAFCNHMVQASRQV